MTKLKTTNQPASDAVAVASFQGLQSILANNREQLLHTLLRLCSCRAAKQLPEAHRDEIYFITESLINAEDEVHLAELSISRARGFLIAVMLLVLSDDDSAYLLTEDEDHRSALNLLNELLGRAEEIKSQLPVTIKQR